MSIQYLAPGFKLTTFLLLVSSRNHKTRAPTQVQLYYSRSVNQQPFYVKRHGVNATFVESYDWTFHRLS